MLTTVVMPPPPIPWKTYIGIVQYNGKETKHAVSDLHLLCLTYASSDKIIDIPGETAEQATGAEDRICKQQACFSTKDIAQLPIQRLKRCQCEKV